MRSSIRESEPPPQLQRSSLIDTLFLRKVYFLRTPHSAKITMLIVALAFFVIAIATLAVTLNVKQYRAIYANGKTCVENKKESATCVVTLKVEQEMQAPIYLLYYVENVYINHKKYLSSFSIEQLKGKAISAEKAQTQCYPIVYNRDLPFNQSWGGSSLRPDQIASPCGLKAMLFFNDTFKLRGPQGPVALKEDGIYSGKAIKTKRQPQSEDKQWIDPQSEHFKLHMLDGSLMTKKRVWGRIGNNLEPGEYKIEVKNDYLIGKMEIAKGVELSTVGLMGSRNFYFPVFFGLAGVACLGYAALVHFKLNNYEEIIRHSYT